MKAICDLREYLAKLAHFGCGIVSGDQIIRGKNESRNCPPTHDDFVKATSYESLDGMLNLSWPVILRQSRRALLGWWVAFEQVDAALRSLPKRLVDDQNKPPVERWSAELSRLLSRLAVGVQSTKPPTGEEWNVGLAAFTWTRLPETWASDLARLCDFDRDLQAVELAVADEAATDDPATDNEAYSRLVATLDDVQARIVVIAADESLTTQERLRLIAALDRRFYGKDAIELATLLGVSDRMIRKTVWWKVERREWSADQRK